MLKPVVLLGLSIAFAAISLPSRANAQNEGALNEPDLKKIEDELLERAAVESRLKNEAADREKELAALRRQMIETANSLQNAQQQIGEINDEIARLESEEQTLTDAFSVQQENLGDVLAALQSLERTKPPALLVSPDDANKAARIAMLLSDAAPALEEKASEIRRSIDELAAIRADLDRERANFEKTNEEINSRRTILAELVEKKQAERDVAASLAAAAQKETAALAARATSLRGILQRLERFARSITPRVKPPAPDRSQPTRIASPSRKPPQKQPSFAPTTSFSKAVGALRAPVAGRLTGIFRERRPEGGRFDGIRFVTRDNAIVTAPFHADVAFARAWDPIGNLIVLDVGEGYHILFMGVGAFLVEEGQEVAAGEPLGTMRGTNARLDLEIRKNGEPVNPSLWLSGKSNEDDAF